MGKPFCYTENLGLTKDIDITLGVDRDRIEDVLSFIKLLNLSVLVDNPREFAEQSLVLPCADSDSSIRIDFIFSSSDYEREAITRVNKVKLDNQLVQFVSLEDLIVHKVIAGRERDKEDVRVLLIKNPDHNKKLIQDSLATFDEAMDGDFSQSFESLAKEVL